MGKKGQIPWNKGFHMWANTPHPKGMLGKPAWNKGIPITLEARQKNSIAHQGVPSKKKGITGLYHYSMSEERKLRISIAKMGHPVSQEQRERQSKSMMGKPSSEYQKQRVREANLKRVYTPWSEESKQRQSARVKKYVEDHPEERARLLAMIPGDKTGIERKVEEQLITAGIKHEIQKPLENITRADFFIPPHDKFYKGIVLYTDGDHWHEMKRNKSRDKYITKGLFNKGYYVVRVSDKEIEKRRFQITDVLKEVIPLEGVKT